jgi:hypothetical protein
MVLDTIISAADVRKLFRYDPDTGIFIRLYQANRSAQWNSAHANKVAGCINGNGYVEIEFMDKPYQAHRLAWLHMTGEWPKNWIDHVNRVKSDNRFSNLREATREQNFSNMDKYKNNTSGFTGVVRSGRRWKSVLQHNKTRHYIGSFGTPEEAREAYIIRSREIRGEFHCD